MSLAKFRVPAVLGCLVTMGTVILPSHQLALADSLDQERKVETATSSSDPAVRTETMTNFMNHARILRTMWRNWAEAHSALLQQMYHSHGENQDLLASVCHFLPKYPTLGSDAGHSVIPLNEVFTWQPIEESDVSFNPADPQFNKTTPKFRNQLLRNFKKYHDVVISESVNSWPTRIEIWASGRITKSHFESKFAGHHMPFQDTWTVVSEIEPPFDFVARNTQ